MHLYAICLEIKTLLDWKKKKCSKFLAVEMENCTLDSGGSRSTKGWVSLSAKWCLGVLRIR